MRGSFTHSQNVFESTFATVTSGGHWFNATRESVEAYVPGLLEEVDYEDLVLEAVHWIDSTDSISLLLFFALVFLVNPWIAAALVILFYFLWFFYKSACVNLLTTPLLKLLNQDILQIATAGIVLSVLGITGNYAGFLIGVIFFFLFKVGLLRLALNRLEPKFSRGGMSLNDRVLRMVLVRHAIREDLVPADVRELEEQIRKGILAFREKTKRKT